MFLYFRSFTFMKSRNGHTIVKAKPRIRKVSALTKESPETVIMRLVRNGKLADAGRRAMKSSLKKGLAVTILEGGKIYRVYPNGARKLIKSIASPKRRYTGKARIA